MFETFSHVRVRPLLIYGKLERGVDEPSSNLWMGVLEAEHARFCEERLEYLDEIKRSVALDPRICWRVGR